MDKTFNNRNLKRLFNNKALYGCYLGYIERAHLWGNAYSIFSHIFQLLGVVGLNGTNVHKHAVVVFKLNVEIVMEGDLQARVLEALKNLQPQEDVIHKFVQL